MIFILSSIAHAEDLNEQIRQWTNPLNKTVVVATQDSDLFQDLEKVLRKDSTLPAVAAMIPRLGDFASEIERARARHDADCLLLLERKEDKTLSIQDFGQCTPDENSLTMYIEDYRDHWRVYDQDQSLVDVHSFAKICNDYTLQARVEQEDVTVTRATKILSWGSAGFALASLFPIKNEEAGFTAAEQDRIWTSLFLLSTAALIYNSRHIPNNWKAERRREVSNYYTREEAQTIIRQRFPPPPPPPVELPPLPEDLPALPEEDLVSTEQEPSEDTSEAADEAPQLEPEEQTESNQEEQIDSNPEAPSQTPEVPSPSIESSEKPAEQPVDTEQTEVSE